MFVRSLMDRDVVYRKGGTDWVIKAGTATYVDESKVSARELKGLYGSRIIIVSRDAVEDEVARPLLTQKVEDKQFPKKVEVPKLDEDLIDDIITQIEKEAENEEAKRLAEEKAKKEAEEKAKKLEEERIEKEAKRLAEEKAKKLEEEKIKRLIEEQKKEIDKKSKEDKKVSKSVKATGGAKRRGRRKVNK